MTTPEEEPVTEADLHAWLDGELPEERKPAVRRYLDDHPDVARRFASYREQQEMLGRAFTPLINRPLPDSLEPPFSRPRRRSLALLTGFAVAASLLMFVAGGATGWLARGWMTPAGGPDGTFVANAVAAHRVFVTEVRHPVEVGADQEEHLVTWLGKRIGKPLRAPRLSNHGYELVGGRLLSDMDGPAAQLMYQDAAGRRITLYVRPSRDPANTSFRFAGDHGVRAFYWADNGLAWALTGELERGTLSALAEEVYRALNT